MARIIVIFGSSVSTTAAGDIDVAIERDGKWGSADEKIVRAWAKKCNLNSTIRLDIHEEVYKTDSGYKFWNPIAGRGNFPGEVAVLKGQVTIGHMTFDGLSSKIRAGVPIKDIVTSLEDEYGFRLSLCAKKGEKDDGAGDFNDYIEGIVSLKSAKRHTQIWDGLMAALGDLGHLLNRLVSEEIRPAADFAESLENDSPNAGGSVALSIWKDPSLGWLGNPQYASEKAKTIGQLEALLYSSE